MARNPGTDPDKRILLHADQSSGAVSVIESTMPVGAPGPPLHVHDFDEAFYVLEGEIAVQLGDTLCTFGPGELAFAPRGAPHTLANPAPAAARYLIICTPAGFERRLARRAADQAGTEPPAWALCPAPDVTYVGGRIGEH
jgi:mannose-6-phosphate isomerase-like protein (cupin superfamily)